MNERYAKLTLALALSFVLAACATTRVGRDAQPPAPAKVASSAADAGAALGAQSSDKRADHGKLYKGTGILVAGQEEGGTCPRSAVLRRRPGPW